MVFRIRSFTENFSPLIWDNIMMTNDKLYRIRLFRFRSQTSTFTGCEHIALMRDLYALTYVLDRNRSYHHCNCVKRARFAIPCSYCARCTLKMPWPPCLQRNRATVLLKELGYTIRWLQEWTRLQYIDIPIDRRLLCTRFKQDGRKTV